MFKRRNVTREMLVFFFYHSGENLLKKWMDYFGLELSTVAMIGCFAE